MSRYFLNILFVLISLSQIGNAQTDTLTVLHSEDFRLTGQGTYHGWENTEWISLPIREGGTLYYETKAKTLYSSTGIYFLFYCSDQHITATLDDDFDDLYNEDVVEVFLHTDESFPFYFEYELSPKNVELPIFVPNIDGDFFGWRPWHYEGERKTRRKTHILMKDGEVQGWMAEFFIPFALLKPMAKVPPVSGTIWRGNLYRIDYDEGVTHWTWQPIRTNFHDYERFGWFQFK